MLPLCYVLPLLPPPLHWYYTVSSLLCYSWLLKIVFNPKVGQRGFLIRYLMTKRVLTFPTFYSLQLANSLIATSHHLLGATLIVRVFSFVGLNFLAILNLWLSEQWIELQRAFRNFLVRILAARFWLLIIVLLLRDQAIIVSPTGSRVMGSNSVGCLAKIALTTQQECPKYEISKMNMHKYHLTKAVVIWSQRD